MKTLSISRFAVPAALVVAALALTGCSGDDGKKKQEEEGPLQKYMSAMWGGEEQNQEYYDKQNAKTEELVAECMSKEGFEYKPNTQNGGMVIAGDEEDSDEPEWGSVKFAEIYGYGTVDWPGMEETENLGEGDAAVDPNQKYIESLTESEQAAYSETLHGPPLTEEQMNAEDEGGMEYDWKNSGCYGAAQHETQGESAQAYDDPEFKDLFEQMNEMYAETYGDGEKGSTNEDMVKLDRKWTECMAEAGYDYTTSMQPRNELNEEWNEKQNAGYNEETGEYKEPTKAEKKQLEVEKKKFKEKESKIAVADAKCQEKIKYTEEQQKISNKIEQKFLDEHKAELDAMLAKYGSKKKDK